MGIDYGAGLYGDERDEAILTDLKTVQSHRVHQYSALLLGDAKAADEVAEAALRRMWDSLRRGEPWEDAVEILYRSATRLSLERLRKNNELRGYQPPTTGDDRLITAIGILGGLSNNARAAAFLTLWGGLDYRRAGVATGLGASRVQEAAVIARQDFLSAKGVREGTADRCQEIGPLLSSYVDGELPEALGSQVEEHLQQCDSCRAVAAAYREIGEVLRTARPPGPGRDMEEVAIEALEAMPRRAGGLRGLLRMASGPGILLIVLIVGLVIIPQCEQPTIQTGRGRTSDVVYALGEQDVVLVDTGSGREIGRTAKGVLTADGQRIYASSEGCRENSRRTAVLAIDALTLDAEELGCVDGRQEIVAVSPERNNLLISDGPQSLAVYGVAERAVKGSIAMPAGAVPLGPARAVSNENRYLFTAGTGTGEAVTVVRVDMTEVRIDGSTTLEAARGAVGLAPLLEGGRVLVYEAQAGRLYDVEPGGMGVIRQLDMTGGGPGGEGRLSSALAVDATGRSAFVALPGGGIAEVDLAGFEVRGILAAESHFSSVAVSSDGQLLYAAERAAGYAVVERETGKVALRREPLKLTGFLRVEAGQ